MIAQVTEPEIVKPASPPSAYEWQWGWAIAVAVNLPVPLGFGLLVVAKSGVFGMFAGIAAVWLVGAAAVVWAPGVRRTLVYGGGLFAFSQLFPIAQFLAGAVALDRLASADAPMSELTGFLVTVATGGQLVLAVLLCGLLVHAVCWLFAARPQRHPV